MNLMIGKDKARHRTVQGAPRKKESGGASAFDEVADTLSGEIARCAARATEYAILLESVGVQTFDATGEIFRDARSAELLQVSHRIRGLVGQALGVLAELQCIAGRLDALAALRAAGLVLEPTDDGG
jgi:hypothetical protein